MEGINNNSKSKRKDKEHSMYMCWTYFKNGKSFPGYSKSVGWGEKGDPHQNLINFILRIGVDNEYLIRNSTRVTRSGPLTERLRIEYFHNINYNEYKQPEWLHFLTLDYDNPEWIEPEYAVKDVVIFLSQLYDKLRRGVHKNAIMEDLYIRTKAPKGDPLSLEKPRFANALDLQYHCNKLKRQGVYSHDVINHFEKSYLQKYFNR